MYGLILKFKMTVISLVILTALIFSFIDKNSFLKDFSLGAASVVVLFKIDEGIGNLKREKNENELNEEKITRIKE